MNFAQISSAYKSRIYIISLLLIFIYFPENLYAKKITKNKIYAQLIVQINKGELLKAETVLNKQLTTQSLTISTRIEYLTMLGDVFFYKGKYTDAINEYKQALSLAKQSGNSRKMAEQYKNIGISHSELSEFSESLQWLYRSKQILKENGWQKSNISLSILLTQSSIYGYIGAIEQAMETVTKAQNLAIELNKLNALGDSYLRLASIYMEQNNTLAAISSLKLVNTTAMNDRSSLAWYYNLYADALIQQNQTDKAHELINQALSMDIKWTHSDLNAFELKTLESHLQDGNIKHASKILNELALNNNAFIHSWVLQSLLAKLYKLEKKHKKSFETNLKAVSLFFKNIGFNQPSDRNLFFEIPTELIEATLVDAMDIGFSNHEVVFELFYLAFLAKEPIQVKKGTKTSFKSEASQRVESAVIHDILNGEASINFSNLLKISSLQGSLKADEGYVFYLTIAGHLYSLLVTSHNTTSIVQRNQSETLKNLVIKLLTQIETNDKNWKITAHQLDDYLIKPLRHLGLEKLKTVHFIQDANLRFLPMDLLIDEQGKYLSDRHQIGISTVKSLKKYLNTLKSKNNSNKTTLNLIGVSDGKIKIPGYWHTAYRNFDLANSNLPSVNKELNYLKRTILHSTLTLGKFATESNAKKIIENAQGVLHFASHGFDNPIAPAYSSLLLKADKHNDGLLQAREISGLTTHAQLVVLASCSSAKGGLSGLYGYNSGLAESFIHAGARTVIGSLWDVKDHKTYQLMQWFYQGLADQMNTITALNFAKKQAQLSGWPVYDWSAFILLGQTDLKLNLKNNTNSWIIITLLFIILCALLIVAFYIIRNYSHLKIKFKKFI